MPQKLAEFQFNTVHPDAFDYESSNKYKQTNTNKHTQTHKHTNKHTEIGLIKDSNLSDFEFAISNDNLELAKLIFNDIGFDLNQYGYSFGSRSFQRKY